MSRLSSKSWSLSDDEENDEFFQKYAEQRRKVLLASPKDPMKIVVEFLKNTKIPYAIIGGKAAAFHLQINVEGSAQTKALALSTNDYDVIVENSHGKEFVNSLQTALKENTNVQLDEQRYTSDVVDIVLMGVMKKGMLDSIVDVHILKPAHSKHFPNKIVKDVASGLKYADKLWICKELQYSMKYHASNDEMTKAMKRIARFELLKC